LPEVPEITVGEYLAGGMPADTQLVDVREPEEWAAGHIPRSVHIPMDQLPSRFAELDRSRPVITVCRSGRRSLYSATDLLQAGFADVRSLAGGIIAWAEAGQPVEL
jgi:rhodanese-related sulfurtransferase